MENSAKKPFWKKWWFILIVVLVLIGIFSDNDKESSPEVSKSAPEPTIQLPSDQSALISLVAEAQKNSRSAENDMQRGGIKAIRDKGICNLVRAGTLGKVKDWIGKVNTIDSNSDGLGVLDVEIADNVVVKTWNNSFSDFQANTLLKPESEIFQKASMLKVGQRVSFSGTFIRGDDDRECLKEGSLTLEGKLSEPEFIFKFSDIKSI